MTLKELDTVRVKKDFPEYKIKKGDVGIVLEIFNEPDEVYLVEFSDSSGEAISTEFFKAIDLEKVE